jgi:RNA polymerase sigma factor (sigma-70 family)
MAMDSDELLPTRWTLISRLKNLEDQESWREFFDLYWRLIFGAAVKSGLTHAEAEDVVQETVLSVSRKIAEFKADPAAGSFKGWLLKLTRWRIIDQVRKRSRAQPLQAGDSTGGKNAIEERLPDPSGNFLDVIWEEEWRKNLISAALEKVKTQISAKHFQIFYLHVIKDLRAENVAKALDIKIGQVHLIKHRALPLFQKALRDVETQTF